MKAKGYIVKFLMVIMILGASGVVTDDAYGQQTSQGESFLKSIGFFADINVGYDLRFNGYSTYDPLLQSQIPVSYSTKELSVIDLSLQTGLLRAPFVNLEYQSSVPRTDFQEEALAFQEDNTRGFEKYGFIANTAPLWELILSEKTMGTLKWILSGKFRTVRELTQASASVEESSLFLRDIGSQGPQFDEADTGDSYSFTTEYRYNSYTWPLVSNLRYDEDEIKANFQIFVGYANWDFDRSYATFFPNYNDQVIYAADIRTHAATAEMHINSRRNFEQERNWGFNFRLVYGYGFDNTFQGDGGDDLRDLFYPGQDKNIDIANQNYEVEFAYKQYLFTNSNSIDLSIKPGLNANVFWTSFGDYQEPNTGEESFNKIDYIITPWVEISIGIL